MVKVTSSVALVTLCAARTHSMDDKVASPAVMTAGSGNKVSYDRAFKPTSGVCRCIVPAESLSSAARINLWLFLKWKLSALSSIRKSDTGLREVTDLLVASPVLDVMTIVILCNTVATVHTIRIPAVALVGTSTASQK